MEDAHLAKEVTTSRKTCKIKMASRETHTLIYHLKVKLFYSRLFLKPLWTYGIQLWVSASISNLNIVHRFQSKILQLMLSAPWYVRNDVIHNDNKSQTIVEEVKSYSFKFLQKLENHVDHLAIGG